MLASRKQGAVKTVADLKTSNFAKRQEDGESDEKVESYIYTPAPSNLGRTAF
jgi:hypothetical protein